jgi:hypothetical protein
MASSASAELINVNGQLVPKELAGVQVNGQYQKYRLIFVTAGGTAATNTDPGFYDTFVRTEANRAGSVFQGQNSLYNWQAVVSVGSGTSSDSITRRASTVLSGGGLGGLGIYNLGGVSLGTGTTIVNSGDVAAAVEYHQFMASAGNAAVWTGSDSFGNPALGPAGFWLGAPELGAVGQSNSDTGAWLGSLDTNNTPVSVKKSFNIGGGTITIGLPVYGVSGELVAIPEPSTIALWSVCASVVGLVAWRKRRKSS